MSRKKQAACEKVIEVAKNECEKLRMRNSLPQKALTDFELAIIRAIQALVRDDGATACSFT